MRLDELTPSVFRQLKKDTAKEASPYYYQDIMPYLEYHGYREITNHGTAFSDVWVNDESNFVIKISRNPDECYLAFATYAMNNYKNDKHLPKTKVLKFQNKDEAYFVTIIERLEPLIPEQARLIDNVGNTYNNIVKNPSAYKDIGIDTPVERMLKSPIKDMLKDFVRKNYSLFKSLSKIRKAITTCRFDLHKGNVMQREDGTYVIIDPVSYKLSEL